MFFRRAPQQNNNNIAQHIILHIKFYSIYIIFIILYNFTIEVTFYIRIM